MVDQWVALSVCTTSLVWGGVCEGGRYKGMRESRVQVKTAWVLLPNLSLPPRDTCILLDTNANWSMLLRRVCYCGECAGTGVEFEGDALTLDSVSVEGTTASGGWHVATKWDPARVRFELIHKVALYGSRLM